MYSLFNIAASRQALREMSIFLQRNAGLILAFIKRDLTVRYKGKYQFMGIFWVIGHPLALTLMYLFIFGIVFKQRMGGTYDLPLDYTAYILSGLIPWLTFNQAMITSCSSITSNIQLVKQFNFDLEILPIKDSLMTLVLWFVGIFGTIIYVILSQKILFLTWILLPVILMFHMLAMLGLGFALSALTVFVRDIKDFMQVFSMINIFLMPVVYRPESLPAIFKPLIYINPFSAVTFVYQDVIYFGRIEHPIAWLLYSFGSVFIFIVGYRTFRRMKPHFSSMI